MYLLYWLTCNFIGIIFEVVVCFQFHKDQNDNVDFKYTLSKLLYFSPVFFKSLDVQATHFILIELFQFSAIAFFIFYKMETFQLKVQTVYFEPH